VALRSSSRNLEDGAVDHHLAGTAGQLCGFGNDHHHRSAYLRHFLDGAAGG
jgi:hypothetical protein